MRWIRSGLQSLSGWVKPPLPVTHTSSEQLDAIRHWMLESLGPAGESRWPGLAARIRFCREVETLWATCAQPNRLRPRLARWGRH